MLVKDLVPGDQFILYDQVCEVLGNSGKVVICLVPKGAYNSWHFARSEKEKGYVEGNVSLKFKLRQWCGTYLDLNTEVIKE